MFAVPTYGTMEVQDIIDVAGGLRRLGDAVGVDHSTVSGWKRCGRIPVHRARRIHEVLKIPLHEIRPDIWPPAEAAE
jgi:DNA-binding transcriptional regulator YdaS (Cro superfamily)